MNMPAGSLNRTTEFGRVQAVNTKGDADCVALRLSRPVRNYGRGLAVRCSAGCDGCDAGAVEVLEPDDEDPDDEDPDDVPEFDLP